MAHLITNPLVAKFTGAAVKRLLDHSRNHPQDRVMMLDHRDPADRDLPHEDLLPRIPVGLWLCKDQGVYLMANCRPNSEIVYDPTYGKGHVPGDDFVEFIDGSGFDGEVLHKPGCLVEFTVTEDEIGVAVWVDP